MSIQDEISARVAKARTFLFVPGNRHERFQKAARSGADVVILDLEDGVAPGDKPTAREAIARGWLDVQAIGIPIVVRLNALSTVYGEDDLAWATHLHSPAAVMLPKAESAAPIERVHDALGGVPAGLTAVAGARGVLRLFLGNIDFMADTGIVCGAEEAEVAPLRFAIALATRTFRLASPVDGVTIQISDLDRLRSDTLRAIRFGFGGKMCIHPSQVPVIHDACCPADDELAWARKVLAADEAAGGAATQVDGKLVDLPVVLQARRTLARAAA
jgi:citrate lyase subunit beta/citryl-CoA lyase